MPDYIADHRVGTPTRREPEAEGWKPSEERGAVLVIAKLDRLARSVRLISGLTNSEVEFVDVDMPTASRLTWNRVGIV